ncbi:hypothetical protein AGMMS49975_06600 [Clostridia bacterium]|nr:hypothetical protein AGMMS49975_06600 [Clostridia bacterium]
MAIYHNNIKAVSRGSPRSVIAISAYINRGKMHDELSGLTYDYSKRTDLVYSEVMLCDNAPENYKDNRVLWAEVNRVENGNGQSTRTVEVSLPKELNLDEQIKLVQGYVKDNFTSVGMCANIAIHDKQDGNPHAHIMLTLRKIDENGEWEYKAKKLYVCKNQNGVEKNLTANEWRQVKDEWQKQLPYYKDGNLEGERIYLTDYEYETGQDKYKDYLRIQGKNDPKTVKWGIRNKTLLEWNNKNTFLNWREDWANKINNALSEKEIPQRVDHRSYEKQGIEKLPTVHLGKAHKLERDGFATDQGNKNRAVAEKNAELEIIDAKQTLTEREILKVKIDGAVDVSSSFDEFLEKMKSENYEIKQGKHIAFKSERNSKYIRSKSIGENYTEDAIKKRVENRTANISETVPETQVAATSKIKIANAVDECISSAQTFEELLQNLQSAGYESKGFGNYIAFREKDTDNKFELLGENYTEFALRKKIKNQLYEQSKSTQVKSLIDIENYKKAKDNKGLANWAERTNLQQKMNTLNFLSQQGVSTYEELSEKANAFNSQTAQSGEEIKSIETKLKEISALIKDIETYQKTKPTNIQYQKVPPKLKAKFYEDNRADLTLFEAANNATSRAKADTDLPISRKLLIEMRGELTAQKDKLYAEYMSLKKKSTELNIAKDTMERMLKIDSPEKSSSAKRNNQNLE